MRISSVPNEFADWLSPILVKELRQGLRTRLFVVCFMLLQSAMALLTILSLAYAKGGNSTEPVGYFIGLVIAVPLFILLPAAGLNVIEQERRAGTLELILLTRLTARRILFGKWAGLVIQAVLLAATVLPYLVLRYFMGGINLVEDLSGLTNALLLSIVLSGVAVGFSTLPRWLTRTLYVLGILFSVFGGIYLMAAIPFSGVSLFGLGLSGWALVVMVVWFVLAILLFAWEFGAGLIAPEAENHSTPIRLLALLNIGVAAVVAITYHRAAPFAIWAAITLSSLVCVGLLCEKPRYLPSIYRPFIRRGWLGQMVGWFLYPGWPSGVVFTLVVGGLIAAVGQRALTPPHLLEYWVGALTVIGAQFFPFAVLRLFRPELRHPFLSFILFQVIFNSLVGLLSAVLLAVTRGADFSSVVRINPAYAPFVRLGSPHAGLWQSWGGALVVSALCLLLLLWRAQPVVRKMQACVQLAKN